MNKQELLDKIKALDGLSQDERSYLINLVNTKKKYGLVWEDKPEAVEEELRTKLPVLKEVKERAIVNDTETDKHPNHILIEGDNLHALTALTFTHEGKIDVIYIDPPYNTGNNDFIYNDKYVDKEDAYRHSKWLSFMEKRLKIAKRLLTDDGLIFISIGDDEQSQLKLLCDELFGSLNFVSNVPRVAKKTSDKGTYFKPTKDYILVYAKQIQNLMGFGIPKTDDIKKYKYEDKYGKYKKSGAALYQPSLDSRPNQRYWIECPDGSFVIPPGNNFPGEIADASFIKPENNDDKVWRWSWPTYLEKKDKLMYFKTKTSPLVNENRQQAIWNIYDKVYWSSMDGETNLPEDIIYDFKNSQGTKHLLNMGIKFSFSKPYQLIEYLLYIIKKTKDITVLDFFAGSGTTLEAVMHLNSNDKGNRKTIIVTNNEKDIAFNVTYKRSEMVIGVYVGLKGEKVDGLKNNNLRYYQCDYVERTPNLKNKRQLTQLATELLCIKEDCYDEICMDLSKVRVFGKNDSRLLILYDDDVIPQVVEWIKGQESNLLFKVYVFAMGSEPYTEDFLEVRDKVQLCALPDAIYKAYRHVLPKEGEPVVIANDDEPAGEQTDEGGQLELI